MSASLNSKTRLLQVGTDELIGGEEAMPEAHQPYSAALTEAATRAVFLALKALSQRTIVALANLFTLLTAGSVCYLWLQVLPEPNIMQVQSVSIYSVFILLLHLVIRRQS